jgi:hypothetical protein
MEKTFISAKLYDKTVTISGFAQDVTMMELLEMFQALAIGLTFSPDTWEDAIIESAEDYTNSRNLREAHRGDS